MGEGLSPLQPVSAKPITTVELTEYKPKTLARSEFPETLGEKLYHEHQNRIEVEFPTPKTGHPARSPPSGDSNSFRPATPQPSAAASWRVAI